MEMFDMWQRTALLLCLLPAALVARQTIHVVFSCHLDIGFDGITPYVGFDNTVINTYFDVYFPKAIRVAEELRQRGGHQHLKFMTHAYLVSLYLDCPSGMGLHCPDAQAVSNLEAAIARGDLYWHAFPHNAQVEVMDSWLFEYGVQLVHDLDTRFGLAPKVTMSQRDVPGLTRAAVPFLTGQGVRALSVGVNGGSAPPGVPHNAPFWWRDVATGTQLLAFWHPGGYSPRDPTDAMVIDGFPHVLYAAWRGDNAGPPSADEVERVINRTREVYPNATIVTSTLDEYVQLLLDAAPDLGLPIVEQEIGDTWIHGIASDPRKLAEFRALLRIRSALHWDSQEPWYRNFSRFLLKVPEHTWGVDIKTTLRDEVSWSNAALASKLHLQELNYVATVHSWQRQHAYIQWALDALASQPQHYASALAAVQAVGQNVEAPSVSLSAPNAAPRVVDDWSNLTFATPHWRIRVCNRSGHIVGLQRGASAEDTLHWASAERPLFSLRYQAYTEGDYEVIWSNYTYFQRAQMPWWFYQDFGKPGCSMHAATRHQAVQPTLERVELQQDDHGGTIVSLHMSMPTWTVHEYGGCARYRLHLISPANDPQLFVDVVCVNKTATRLPEAMFVTCNTGPAAAATTWRMYKLGHPISPLDIVFNGSKSLHAVSEQGVSVDSVDGTQQLTIQTLDAALVSPGYPTVFPNTHHDPDLQQGMSFNLWNNVWYGNALYSSRVQGSRIVVPHHHRGTNYVMWFPYDDGDDGSLRFRFVVDVSDVQHNVEYD